MCVGAKFGLRKKKKSKRELHESGVSKKKNPHVTFGAFPFISQEKTYM
jgi:hypothetical protein